MGLGSSLGAAPGGQPSASSLNPPSQIDPSSIERAYAALGLTYQGNQMAPQPAQTSLPNQGLPVQAGMRSLNAMSECTRGSQGAAGTGVGEQGLLGREWESRGCWDRSGRAGAAGTGVGEQGLLGRERESRGCWDGSGGAGAAGTGVGEQGLLGREWGSRGCWDGSGRAGAAGTGVGEQGLLGREWGSRGCWDGSGGAGAAGTGVGEQGLLGREWGSRGCWDGSGRTRVSSGAVAPGCRFQSRIMVA